MHALPGPRREVLGRLLLSLFHNALDPRQDSSYRDYKPVQVPAPARHAIYSANLLMLAILAAGEVTGDQLFPQTDDQVLDWRALALLWRSQLPPEGWTGLVETLALDRRWHGDQRYIRLRLSQGKAENIDVDPYWMYAFCVEPWNRHTGYSWTYSTYGHQRLKNHFLCHHSGDALAHALDPLAAELGVAIQTFSDCGQDHPVSAANALIRLWITAGQDSTPSDLMAAYAACFQIALRAFSPLDTEARDKYRTLVLHQLAADRSRLPEAWLETMMEELNKVGPDFAYQVGLILGQSRPADRD
jgi:hypothetical protein